MTISTGLRTLLILAIATISEFLGLFFWVQFVDDGQQALGIFIMVIGLLAERISVILTVRDMYGENPLPQNFYAKVLFSAFVESAIWIVWLLIWDSLVPTEPSFARPLVGVITMFGMQTLAHSWQMSFALNKPPIFQYAKDGLTIIFSLIEAVGTAWWLVLVRDDQLVFGATVLLLTFVVEHIVQGIAISKASPPIFDSATE